jgi:hypothetical protein
MVDWTTVLVSLVSGAAGLGGGLYAAKLQADAVLHQVRAETDRFGAQQAEEQRRGRETVYLEFVVCARKFSGHYARLGHAHLTPEAEDDDDMMRLFVGLREEWFAEFLSKQGAVRLFGTDAVRSAVDELSDAIGEVEGRVAEAIETDSAAKVHTRISDAWQAVPRDRLDAAARQVVDEMRADIVRWRTAETARPSEPTEGPRKRPWAATGG